MIVIDNPPVNAPDHGVRAGLVAAVAALEGDADARVALILDADRLFLRGADISEFGKPPMAQGLGDVVARIKACAKPVVAALHGAALGGGPEFAPGCHSRLAMPGARLDLPEVTLGLIPGPGRTQRVPRLTGLAAALELVQTV